MSDMIKVIQERHSVRQPFNVDKPVSDEELTLILEAARWAPTAHNMQNYEIVVVDDPAILDKIASIQSPISEVFIRENYQQLSFSEEELKRKKAGILGNMFPVSWITPGMKPEVDERGSRSFIPCSTLLIMLYDPSRRAPASEGDFLGIISLGCMTENMWLEAESLGVDFHITSGLANDGIAEQIKNILFIPAHLKIVFGIRLGHALVNAPAPLRVRRDIEDFCHHNRFGIKGI